MSKESLFEQYLQDKLSFKRYSDLSLLLNLSPHRVTKIIASPQIMTVEEVKDLANLCAAEPIDLIMDFECGFESVTVKDAIALGMLSKKKP